MIVVPIDTPGFEGIRPVPVMGHDEGPGPLGGPLRRRARARGQPAGRARRRLRDRAGPARPRPDPPLHARDRVGRAGVRAHVPARARAHLVRRAAGREAVRPGLHRQVAHGDRLRAPDGAPRGMEDGHRGQARRPPGHLDDQGDRRPDAPARGGPGDAGARRARHVRRHAAGRDVAPGPLAADRRRARRGAQDGDRPARAQPLQAARAASKQCQPRSVVAERSARPITASATSSARSSRRSATSPAGPSGPRTARTPTTRRWRAAWASSAGTASRSPRSTAAPAAASSTRPCSSRRRRAGRSRSPPTASR